MADVTEILKGGFTLLCGNWIQDRTKPNPKNWKLISKVKDFARDDVSKIQDGFAQLSLERARENLNSAHDLVQKRYEEKGKGKSWSTDPALVTQLQNYYRAAKDAALEHFGYDTTITHRATRIEALQIAMYGEAYGLFVTNQCLGDGVGVEKYLKLIFSDKDLCQALTCVFDRTAETTEIRGDEVIHLIKVLQTLSKQEINEEVIKNSGLISGDSRNYPKKLWERVRNSKLESLIDIGFTTIVDQLRQLYKSKYMKVSPLSFLLPHEFHMDKMWAPLTLRKGGKDNKDYVNGTEAYDKTIKLALKKNRLTIVTGKPYFGKTTLVQKIAYDWAMEKDKDYDLVLVAPIRDVPESKKERPYTKILNMVIAYIEVISGCNFDYLLRMDISNRKLLVILDGYDEERSGHKCSELHNLLQSSDENAPDQLKFDVLITRRPSKAIRRDKKVSFLSITGFHTDELREEFITRYVETIGQDDVSKVMKTIKDMKLDHDLIESPMMLTLICLLHDKLKTGSVSELLDLSIQLLIERWVEKDDENFKVLFHPKVVDTETKTNSIIEWRENIDIMRLGELAYNMLLDMRVICDKSAIKTDDADIFSKMGLLIKDSRFDGPNITSQFEFIHRVFQDFLAAQYVIYWSKEDRNSLKKLKKTAFDQFHRYFIELVFSEILTRSDKKALESKALQKLFYKLKKINIAPCQFLIEDSEDKNEQRDSYLRTILRQCTNKKFLDIWKRDKAQVNFAPAVTLPGQGFLDEADCLQFFSIKSRNCEPEETITLKNGSKESRLFQRCSLPLQRNLPSPLESNIFSIGCYNFSPKGLVGSVERLHKWWTGDSNPHYIGDVPMLKFFFSREMEEALAKIQFDKIERLEKFRVDLYIVLLCEFTDATKRAMRKLLNLFSGTTILKIDGREGEVERMAIEFSLPKMTCLEAVVLSSISVAGIFLHDLCEKVTTHVYILNCRLDDKAMTFLRSEKSAGRIREMECEECLCKHALWAKEQSSLETKAT